MADPLRHKLINLACWITIFFGIWSLRLRLLALRVLQLRCGQAETKVSWFYLPFILNFLLNSRFVIEGAGIWYPVLFLLLLTDYLHFSVNKAFLFVLVLCLKFYSAVALLLELNWFLLERNWSLSKFRCEALFSSSCLSNHLYSCFFAESRISVCSNNESCW